MVSDLLKADFVQDDRDIDQVLALNLSEYGPTSARPSTDVVATRADFAWRCDQNPAGRAIIPVIRDKRGDVAGFLWLIPLKIRIKKQNVLAATGANMVIEPQSRGNFSYVKLIRKFNAALQKQRRALHFSFVSEDVYRRLRVEAPNTISTIPSVIKPLDPGSMAKAYFTKNWQRFIAAKVGRLASTLFFKRPCIGGTRHISIERIDHFDERFDQFWRRVQDKYPAMVIRDRAFLTWRFSPVSGRRYHVLIARKQDEMLGYAVVRCAKVRGIETGLILDMLVLDGSLGMQAGSSLMAHAEQLCRSQRMSLMVALTVPGSAEYRILIRSGYRNLAPLLSPRPFRFAFFIQDSFRKDLESLSIKDWFITLADFESL